MLEFLHRLFIGHNHIWEELLTIRIVEKDGDIPSGYQYKCRCKICGKIKIYKTKSHV